MADVTFSVVICTYNRQDLLADVIASLRAQTYPSDRYEILVVDNASTDGTRAEVERLQKLDGHPVRYIDESRPGQSYARNTGAERAEGDIVVYIDDDAIATPGWLATLAQAFEQDPGIACAGGRIVVAWESEEPDWFLPRFEGFFGGTRRLGEVARDLTPKESLIGMNLAVRISCFHKVGGFATELGPGTPIGFGDDDEFCSRVHMAGHRLAYVPDALVYHRIFPERTTRRYMLNRAMRGGMSSVMMAQLHEQLPRWKLLAGAGLDALRLPGELFKAGLRRLGGQPREAFAQLFLSASRFGRMRQELRLGISPSPSRENHTMQNDECE